MLALTRAQLCAFAAGCGATWLVSRAVSAARRAARAAVAHKPVLYYWPARGRGEQIRLVLAEAGVEFEGRTFDLESEQSKHDFFTECRRLGGHLTTNLPMVYIDGVYLTQNSAVVRYLGRKFGLYPDDVHTAYRVDTVLAVAEDLRTLNYKPLRMFGAGKPEKEQYLRQLPTHLANLVRLLGNGAYFLGDRLCLADLTVYDVLDVVECQVPGKLAARFPTLHAFKARIEARPNIKKWLDSEQRAELFAFPPI